MRKPRGNGAVLRAGKYGEAACMRKLWEEGPLFRTQKLIQEGAAYV